MPVTEVACALRVGRPVVRADRDGTRDPARDGAVAYPSRSALLARELGRERRQRRRRRGRRGRRRNVDELTLLRELAGEPMDDEAARAEVWRRLLEGETPIDREPAARRGRGRRRRRWALVAVAAALVVGGCSSRPRSGSAVGSWTSSERTRPPRFRRTSPPTTRTGSRCSRTPRRRRQPTSTRGPSRRAGARRLRDRVAGRPDHLWSAPTEDGRKCSLIQTNAEAATGHLSCDMCRRSGSKRSGACDDGPTERLDRAPRVSDKTITKVEVEVAGARDVSLQVVAGYAFGTCREVGESSLWSEETHTASENMTTRRAGHLALVGLALTVGLVGTSGAASAPATGSRPGADSAQGRSRIVYISSYRPGPPVREGCT